MSHHVKMYRSFCLKTSVVMRCLFISFLQSLAQQFKMKTIGVNKGIDMEKMNYKYKIDEELKRHLRKKFGIIKWKFDVFLQPEIEDETILFFSKFIREKFYNE